MHCKRIGYSLANSPTGIVPDTYKQGTRIMASFESTAPGAFGAISREDTGILGGVRQRLRTWHRARATARALRGLSHAQLADIGIEPGDIDGFADRLAQAHRA